MCKKTSTTREGSIKKSVSYKPLGENKDTTAKTEYSVMFHLQRASQLFTASVGGITTSTQLYHNQQRIVNAAL